MRRKHLTKSFILPRRETLILLAFFLLAVLAIIARFAFQQGQTVTEQSKTAATESGAGTAAPTPIDPGFDVVRVTREGRAVMAGRAAPGAKVIVKSGDLVLGQVMADKRGDWVMIPETPLKPGAQVLTLSAQLGEDGPVLSKDSAIISVPDRPGGEVFVAVSRPGKPTRILDQGLPDTAPTGVSVAGIDLAPEGGAMLSGRAGPGRLVRVYLDNQAVGEALANEKGEWELAYTGAVATGEHKLRGDQLDPAGKVLLRAEVAFSRAGQGQLVMGAQQVMVMQGNALWEIARNIYGSGIAYSVIFTGNRQQIRDPDLIYPGQIFDIPAAPDQDDRGPAPQHTIP